MPYPTSGALAALITPIRTDYKPDFERFLDVIDFVLERGVDGVVIGGGTAEYPHFTVEERVDLALCAVRHVAGRAKVLASVGASSIHSTMELARSAQDAGCDALLLPMPYFFRYEQQDLAAFVREVCSSVSLPCLLYNLPSFTNPIEVETATELLATVPNLVGMKDSSGKAEALEPLASARQRRNFSLFVGDDSFLLPALQAGWDGVVSGIACCLPEIIVSLYRNFRAGNFQAAEEQQRALDFFIDRLVELPIPWGVRIALTARGVANGPLHLPVSPSRREQVRAFEHWVREWVEQQNFKPA